MPDRSDDPLRAWTPAEVDQHVQDLNDALDDIAWDPTWRPDVVALLVPDPPRTHQTRRTGRSGDCGACRRGRHGRHCHAGRCRCRCRPALGLDGPFLGGDPDAPDPMDGASGVAADL